MSRILLTAALFALCIGCARKMSSTKTHSKKEQSEKHDREDRSEAAEALDFWSFSRTFPDGIFHSNNLQTAFNQRETQLAREDDPILLPNWQSLGPANIAGRMLCLAFHPTDSLVMWSGSASGGLWKTTTGGLGSNAWQRIKTGFPVLGVASIAVSKDAQTLYIGTGEVYGYRNTSNSVGIRTQRGSYGIGILKSTDGGVTWSKSMDWNQNDMKGVQKIVLNPSRQSTVFAATTEGVFRSYDAGRNWTLVNSTPMAVDLEYAPNDTNRLYCTFGSLNNPQNGVFRSLNGGATWTKLANGLPSYSGKTLLDVIPSQPNTLYASVADAERQIGLFKSTNGGDSWAMLNGNDVAAYQGWYSHDVAICPQNPNIVVHIGINASCSTNGGISFNQISNSYTIPFGRTLDIGNNYIHADIHAVYFSPFNQNKTYYVGDGGIYKNDNLSVLWESGELVFKQLNGGLQTTQFYANFSNSQQDSAFAIGGMQDNWTAIYDGQPNWFRVIGGDGMCTAIHPQDDNIVFGSTQYLNILRSNDRGSQFLTSNLGSSRGTPTFNGPFEIAPSNPDVMYAGAERILRSTDGGVSFEDGDFFVDYGNSINNIAVNPLRDSTLFLATFPINQPVAKIFKSTDAGRTVTHANGLPNRVFTDISFAPKDTNMAFATLAGFGTAHVYRTTDAGLNWQPFGAGLPDVPANTVLFDPIYPQFAYVGNDLGVYFSADAGLTWRPLSNQGLPEACIVMHLSLSPKNRKLRAATHGNGVFEMDMLSPQNLRQPVETVFASATMETTNQPIRTNFYLKNTRRGDTIAYALASAANARLPMPTLPNALAAVPDYPFPHPLATNFSDSIFTFKITPTRTLDPREGITTYDIALISRAVLGVDTTILQSPFKQIAADVNGDGSIDGVDILLLRRFILRIDERFANVPSWVFVPKTYPMPAVLPPLSEIPQSYFLNPYALRNPNPFAFTIIKMGDVNNSYEPIDGVRAPQNDQAALRSEGVVWKTEDVFLEADNVYEVNIKAVKSMTCIGFQGNFSLKNGSNTEGSSFLNAESATLENFNETNVNGARNGAMTFSWNVLKNQNFDANTSLLTLKIKAKKSGFLSEILTLNSDFTTAFVFDEKGNEQRLSLKFEKSAPNFTLEAVPNPFSDALNVKIGLNTEGSLRYSIFDNLGKLLHKNERPFKKGVNVLSLNASAVNVVQAGVYFLKIETNDGSKTIKLVKI